MISRPPRHLYGAELLSLTAALGWTLFLTFDTKLFPTGLAYHAMRQLAPAHVWAVLMLTGFMLQLTALCTQRWQAILVADIGAAATWTFIAVTLVQSDPLTAGIWLYAPLAVLQGYRFWPARLQVL